MKVLFYTNEDVTDFDDILEIIQSTGDEVIVHSDPVTAEVIERYGVEFVVSDRSRFLIKPDVLELLPARIINFHSSYLPWNRGYDPNYWSLKRKTPHGVSLHYIDEGIDTGDVIAQVRLTYSTEDTLRTTYQRLRKSMIRVFAELWPDIRLGKLPGIPQDLNAGNTNYKKDFVGVFDQLPAGWDTRIKDL